MCANCEGFSQSETGWQSVASRARITVGSHSRIATHTLDALLPEEVVSLVFLSGVSPALAHSLASGKTYRIPLSGYRITCQVSGVLGRVLRRFGGRFLCSCVPICASRAIVVREGTSIVHVLFLIIFPYIPRARAHGPISSRPEIRMRSTCIRISKIRLRPHPNFLHTRWIVWIWDGKLDELVRRARAHKFVRAQMGWVLPTTFPFYQAGSGVSGYYSTAAVVPG